MKGWILLGIWSSVCLGWDAHFRITETAALSILNPHVNVPFIELDEALSKGVPNVDARNTRELLVGLKLNKSYSFVHKLSEQPQKGVSALAVLSTYSDEPDWGADENLFTSDQYPELWTRDSQYVTKRSGAGSKGFRHMFFSGQFNWRHPIDSFQVPMRSLGEAPHRAAIFYELAGRFFQAKTPYWGYRFLGWALHYIEDLFQPYHVSQSPSKRFMVFDWKWKIFPILNVPASAEQISYYHYSYENWALTEFVKPQSQLRAAVTQEEMATALGDLESFIKFEEIPFSSSFAPQIGDRSVASFQPFDPSRDGSPESFVGSPRWRQGIKPSAQDLLAPTVQIYRRMGEVIRRVIRDRI